MKPLCRRNLGELSGFFIGTWITHDVADLEHGIDPLRRVAVAGLVDVGPRQALIGQRRRDAAISV